ncbi:methyl-accepting chemotaxis protein [Phormidesmis sp. 146-12]
MNNRTRSKILEQPAPLIVSRPQAPIGQPKIQSRPLASSPRRSFFRDWFANLPIRRKHSIALVTCELVPILGLGVGSTLVLTNSLRTQLSDQAKSEVAVIDLTYAVKVNQMSFSARGQSDNIALISAAKSNVEGGLPSDLQGKAKKILQSEVKAHKMEYATLVGKDRKIIVNANNNRAGQVFDPHSLVSDVLRNARQVRASTLVEQTELIQEGAPLPSTYDPQTRSALIRYVVTPIKNPDTQEVIGALVFGDVVNSKPSIVESTVNALGGGYSAVYSRQSTGQFTLTTALERSSLAAPPRLQIELPDQSLLTQTAAAENGKPVTQRLTIDNQAYTLAAIALPERIIETPDGSTPVFSATPTAFLVRGTPEANLDTLLWNSLHQEALLILLSLFAIVAWSVIFRRTVLNAITHLDQTSQNFVQGDRNARAEVGSIDEVGQLSMTFNQMADYIVKSEANLAVEAQRAQQFSDITLQIRQSLKREDILRITVQKVQQALKTDRVVIYQFHEDWSGTIVAESVQPGWKAILNETVNDPFRVGLIEEYRNGRVRVMPDVNAEGLSDCHRDILSNFQIRASMIAPILKDNQLLGLLGAHQCDGPRLWQPSDVAMFKQLAAQIGYALDQADTLYQQEQAQQQAASLFEEQRCQQEMLQQQLVALLANVEGVAGGNLTVRADVTAGDIGIVADFFNAIVENLRHIVTSVKHSAVQVNSLLGANEGAMQKLSEEALQQAEETSRILDSVEAMTQSIQIVADNASQAAVVAKTAFTTAASGEAAMDQTVQSILTLRETIDAAVLQVKQLGDATQQISRIVSLIDDIAVQTDLLALNAGLEASRAGEQGRGFAIVASEVGQLAARSAAATREIEQIVGTIQRETNAVVVAMSQGTTQVIEGADWVKAAKQSLGQVVQVSRQIDNLVQAISQATVSQAVTSRSVALLIKDMTQISERTSNSSRQVSSALRQTVVVAQELQASVETFEVGDVE